MTSKARRPLVLIVDDDPDVTESLAAWLANRFDVVTAEDGREALQVVAERAVDVIVLDLMMPNMDGASFKRALDGLGVSVPVILASAAADVGGTARSLGIRDYLVKPIDLDRLEAMVARLSGSGSGGAPPAGGTRGGRPRGTSESSGGGRVSGLGVRTGAMPVASLLVSRLPAPAAPA